MRLALIQMASGPRLGENLSRAEAYIETAGKQGAQVLLLPELFFTPYMGPVEREELFELAHPLQSHPWLFRFQELSRRYQAFIPVSFFERAGPVFYNSVAVFLQGELAGLYRKSHIPDGPGYEEKFYFAPGDTGFRTWSTPWGEIGVAICWDQWFPEAARIMALKGADLLVYPSTIGSEPPEAGGLETRELWRRVMVGHAVANAVYVAAVNRVGEERWGRKRQRYYGASFAVDYQGELLVEAGEEEGIFWAELDLAKARRFRAGMGFFRDRRPDLYGLLSGKR
jgi:N-carbamoylputrescine amidase